jgi:hypothetical protein
VFPLKYELCFCIPEDDTLHSHCRETLRSYLYMKADAVTGHFVVLDGRTIELHAYA